VAGDRQTLERLKAMVPSVTVIAENPRVPFNVPTCVSKHPTEPERCNFPKIGALEASPAERKGADFAQYLDFADAVCDAQTCRVVVDDMLVYTDMGHYTRAFSRSLAPRLAVAFEHLE